MGPLLRSTNMSQFFFFVQIFLFDQAEKTTLILNFFLKTMVGTICPICTVTSYPCYLFYLDEGLPTLTSLRLKSNYIDFYIANILNRNRFRIAH